MRGQCTRILYVKNLPMHTHTQHCACSNIPYWFVCRRALYCASVCRCTHLHSI